jgi:hypothetical protein
MLQGWRCSLIGNPIDARREKGQLLYVCCVSSIVKYCELMRFAGPDNEISEIVRFTS